MEELNIRQLRFIDNLFEGMSGKKAYIEAGYRVEGHSAESCASQLLRNSEIQEEIERRKEDIDKRNRVRLKRISETALAKLLNIINDDEVNSFVRISAIKDALDRAGLKPVEQSEVTGSLEVRTAIPRPEKKE